MGDVLDTSWHVACGMRLDRSSVHPLPFWLGGSESVDFVQYTYLFPLLA
jgi:hypothetical protein